MQHTQENSAPQTPTISLCKQAMLIKSLVTSDFFFFKENKLGPAPTTAFFCHLFLTQSD